MIIPSTPENEARFAKLLAELNPSMNNEIESSQSYESLPQAVEALCLKVFGAKPMYLWGMWGDTTTQNEEIRVQNRQIKALCEENQDLRNMIEKLNGEVATWSHRAIDEQRRAAALASESHCEAAGTADEKPDGQAENYHFTGTKTDQVKQIGNAVPRRLARAIVAAVVSQNEHVGFLVDAEDARDIERGAA